jgi:autotransporter-associated beta strand protein
LATINGAPVAAGFLSGWAHTANSFMKYDGANVIEIPALEKVTGAANVATATAVSCYYDNLATTTLAANQSIGLVETTRDLLISNGATLDVALGGLMFHNNSHWVKVGSGSGNLTSSSGQLNIAVHGTSTEHQVAGIVVKDFNGTTPLRVVKSGPGGMRLTAANTYTGGTRINNGRLRGSNNSAFGAAGSQILVSGANSQVSLLGGTYAYNPSLEGLGWSESGLQRGALRFEGNSTLNGNVTLTGESRIAANGNVTGIINGTVTGSDSLSIGLFSDTVANSGGTVVLNGSAAGLTAPISVLSGQLDLNAATGGDVIVMGGAALGGEGSIAGRLEIGGSPVSRLFVNGSTPAALAVGGVADLSFGATEIELVAFPEGPAPSFTAFTYGTLDGDIANLSVPGLRGGVVADDPANQRVTVSYTPGTLTWTGSANANWSFSADLNFDNGVATRFFTGDHVSFTETAAVKTVTLVGTVMPASITFDHSSDYTVVGTAAGIARSTGITKNGSGTLTLGGQTSTFTGPVEIQQGRLKYGNSEALGFSSSVTVAAGAQLDLDASRPEDTGRTYAYTIAGGGPDGNGAITNSSATAIYENAGIRALALSGNASVGGNGGRFDIGTPPYSGTITGNGHTLTKVGTSELAYRVDASGSPVHHVVAAGRAWAENTDNAWGGATGSLRVKSGARAGTYGVRSISTPVFLEAGGILFNAGGGKGTWTGTVTLEGNATIESGTAIDITGPVTGGFSLTKTGGQQTLLSQPQHGGDTSVSAGVLALGAATLADTSTVTIGTGAGTKLDLPHGAEDTVAGLVIGTTAMAPGRYGSTASTADIQDDTRFSGTGVLNVVPPSDPYAAWEIANGIGGAGADVDSDGDGLLNGIEFVVGGDPSGSPSNALLPVAGGDATYFELSFRRTDDSAYFGPFVEYGSTLSGWTVAEDGVNGVVIVEENDHFGTGIDRVTVRIPRNLAVGAKLFARLRVEIP